MNREIAKLLAGIALAKYLGPASMLLGFVTILWTNSPKFRRWTMITGIVIGLFALTATT